jgi:hypothetical protein
MSDILAATTSDSKGKTVYINKSKLKPEDLIKLKNKKFRSRVANLVELSKKSGIKDPYRDPEARIEIDAMDDDDVPNFSVGDVDEMAKQLKKKKRSKSKRPGPSEPKVQKEIRKKRGAYRQRVPFVEDASAKRWRSALDDKGITTIVGKKGSIFYWRKSKKSGKKYRVYYRRK